jgi:hypothetical protein
MDSQEHDYLPWGNRPFHFPVAMLICGIALAVVAGIAQAMSLHFWAALFGAFTFMAVLAGIAWMIMLWPISAYRTLRNVRELAQPPRDNRQKDWKP